MEFIISLILCEQIIHLKHQKTQYINIWVVLTEAELIDWGKF